jgi:hypothetical protein
LKLANALPYDIEGDGENLGQFHATIFFKQFFFFEFFFGLVNVEINRELY